MTPLYNYTLALLLALIMAGCIATPKVETIEDGIAVGYISVESAANAAATAYQNKWIDKNQKDRVADSLQQAHDALEESQALVALSRPVEAQDALDYAEGILIQLQQLLQEARP